MGLKLEFVEKASRRGARMSTLCREYGISRETGYKWLNRYKREGADGLDERSRRPKTSPLASSEDVVVAILEVREAYPRRGPKKLFGQLHRRFGAETPSVSTIARVLRRFGKVRQRSRFRRVSLVEHAPAIRAGACNEVWTVDFKGWWRSLDGDRCEPLTVRDGYSRYVLAIKVLNSPSMEPVQAVFKKLFAQYGMPQHIQCDNGSPFINVQARGGFTRLSAWWVSLGIHVLRSRPGCPQDNGAHERMHRDMRSDLQSFPSVSRAAQQRACDRWRQEFNHVRPHEALGNKTPGEVYTRSERRPRRSTYIYPEGWVVRTVTDTGAVNVGGSQITAGKALARERVAFQPLGGQRHQLWFRDVELGTVQLGPANDVIDDVSTHYLRTRPRSRLAARQVRTKATTAPPRPSHKGRRPKEEPIATQEDRHRRGST